MFENAHMDRWLVQALQVVTLLMLLSLVSSIPFSCPEGCQCVGAEVDCTGQGYNELPATYPNNVLKLKLDTNPLYRLKVRAFSYYLQLCQLEYISLKDCSLDYVDALAFEELPRLKEIDLSMNKLILSGMSVAIFSRLGKLERLDLRFNYKSEMGCHEVETSLMQRNVEKKVLVMCDKMPPTVTPTSPPDVQVTETSNFTKTTHGPTPPPDDCYSCLDPKKIVLILVSVIAVLIIICVILLVKLRTKCSWQNKTHSSGENPVSGEDHELIEERI